MTIYFSFQVAQGHLGQAKSMGERLSMSLCSNTFSMTYIMWSYCTQDILFAFVWI